MQCRVEDRCQQQQQPQQQQQQQQTINDTQAEGEHWCLCVCVCCFCSLDGSEKRLPRPFPMADFQRLLHTEEKVAVCRVDARSAYERGRSGRGRCVRDWARWKARRRSGCCTCSTRALVRRRTMAGGGRTVVGRPWVCGGQAGGSVTGFGLSGQ